MKRTMNAVIAIEPRDSVRRFPGLESLADDKEPKRSWFYRAALWTGVIMATPEKPKGWQWNPAVITLVLAIATLIATGGWYMGQKDAENKQILERLQKAEAEASKALQLQSYKAGSVDAMKGHAEDTNSNTGAKK